MKPSPLPTVRRISTYTWHRTSLSKRVAGFIEQLARLVAGH